MAIRPVFVVDEGKNSLIKEMNIEFEFHNGMAISQKQKSIRSLHEAAKDAGVENILEVSTKSETELGNRLSAFNLSYFSNQMNKRISLEAAFQGSKVFEKDGPHTDLYTKEPFEIKKDERIDREKRIIGFEFEGIKWQTEPKTAFYDWIYLKAVKSNIEDLNNTIYEKILNYTAFTDIEFNPKKSINCQARSCALYVSLFKNELLDIALESEEAFLEIISKDSFYKIEKKEDSDQEELDLKF
tara:strand:- start:14 stop:739 length:726 start_codon:yes stop_codon:yes gene_type:complete